jgi:uncharacterized membrane protein
MSATRASPGIVLGLLALMVLGVWFRFSNLDRRVYRYDEAFTKLWLCAHSAEDLQAALAQNRPLPIEMLAEYKHARPGGRWRDVLGVFARTEPHQAPLYVTLLWAWVQVAGDSVKSLRALSATISVLALPLAVWLGWELFGQWGSALLMGALVAVSPIHVVYAQEARVYSLWDVIILLSSAVLLRAVRRPTASNWSLYAAVVGVGLWVHLPSALVVLGHGLYVRGCAGEWQTAERNIAARPTATWSTAMMRRYLSAVLVGVFLCTPWLVNLIQQWAVAVEQIHWLGQPTALLPYIKTIALNFACVVFDARLRDDNTFYYLSVPINLFMSAGLWWLVRRTPRRVWLFVLTLIGPPLAAFGLPDLVSGGVRFSVARYLFPCYIGLQLALAHWLATQMETEARRWWQGVVGVVLAAGIVSDAAFCHAETWWTKSFSRYNWQVARIIGQAAHGGQRPLVISDEAVGILSLSYAIDAGIDVLVVRDGEIPRVPSEYADVFVFAPQPNLQRVMAEQHWHLEPAHEPGQLWRLTRPTA